MQCQSTKIADFKIGDKFAFYGEIFEVTGELKTWAGHNGTTDTKTTYGRSCKIVTTPERSNISELLKIYDWIQGTDEVTYAKIVETK